MGAQLTGQSGEEKMPNHRLAEQLFYLPLGAIVKPVLICPICGKSGTGAVMYARHFKNCKNNPSHIDVWERAHGPRPVESNGRKYAIHHINGDHGDNRLENLQLVTNAEHARIHGLRGDTGTKQMIQAMREKLTDGTHVFYDKSIGSKGCKARNALYGNPMGNLENRKKSVESKIKNGTDSRSRIDRGCHNFVTNHPMKTLYRCTKTGRVNTKTAFTRWYKESLPYLEKV